MAIFKLLLLLLMLPIAITDNGFILNSITMDQTTFDACSTCDARADRAGNKAVADALRNFMTRNHVKIAIESGDVRISKNLPNQKVDTGHSCSRTAEMRDVVVSTGMVNDVDMLDSLDIDYEAQIKNSFISGYVPHELNVRGKVRTYFGNKLWFGKCKNIGRKTCPTSASTKGRNEIVVYLLASDISTADISGQKYLQFDLNVIVEDWTDPNSYGPISAPKGSGCDLGILGIKIGSINTAVQKVTNSYLRSNSRIVDELRGRRLVEKLEEVLEAKLGSTVTIPVNINGGGGGRRRLLSFCQRKTCPSGFSRIANTNKCQKAFGPKKPNCSQYGPSASIHITQIAGGRKTLYFCHADMILPLP